MSSKNVALTTLFDQPLPLPKNIKKVSCGPLAWKQHKIARKYFVLQHRPTFAVFIEG